MAGSIIDVNDYSELRRSIHRMLENNPERCKFENISEFSVAFHCPAIVMCHFFGDKIGFTDKLNARIEMLKEFYQVETVIPFKE